MFVTDYLKNHTLEDLKNELDIEVREYPDLVVLNYGIKSPKTNPIANECRALILEKGSWNVIARSFDRFFNLGEMENQKEIDWENSLYQEKLDGSLMTVYYYKDKWNVSSRSMAFAEGSNSFGKSFADIFKEATIKTSLYQYLERVNKNYCFTFELTSPYNRIVTRYEETSVTLICARNKETGKEFNSKSLDTMAYWMGIKRPKTFSFKSMEDVIRESKALPTLEEGFVIVDESEESFKRIKCKNPAYVAIHNIKGNSSISGKSILSLLVSGEEKEFLSYFPEYQKYFDFVQKIWEEVDSEIDYIWAKTKYIYDQKEFAIAVQNETKNSYILGQLFMRKRGKIKEISIDQLYEKLDIATRFKREFNDVV